MNTLLLRTIVIMDPRKQHSFYYIFMTGQSFLLNLLIDRSVWPRKLQGDGVDCVCISVDVNQFEVAVSRIAP